MAWSYLKDLIDEPRQLAERNLRRKRRTMEAILETLTIGSSGDHAEWLENGFRAITVIRENYKPTILLARVLAKLLFITHQTLFEIEHVHTTKDTWEIIEKEKLEKTVDIVQEMITRIKQQL